MSHNQVSRVALIDITKDSEERGLPVNVSYADRWHITQKDLNTKEVRRLNRQLGIHKINK